MKNLKALGLLAVAGVLTMTACRKREYIYTNNDTRFNSELEAVYDRTVNYAVQVTSQRESGFRGATAVAGATVAVSVGGEIRTATTDASGLAVFSGLRAGSAAVTVSAGSHTTAHYIVNLNATPVTAGGNVDTHSERSAATMVRLLPVSGLGTSTLRGRLEAQRDLTAPGLETVPDDVNASLVARVNFNNFDNNGSGGNIGFSHSGDGSIEDFYYEGLMGTTSQALNSNSSRTYSMTLPATAYGIGVEVLANPYTGNLVLNATDTEPRIFVANNAGTSASPATIWNGTSYTGEVYITNITYNSL